MKLSCVTIQMKAIEQYYCAVQAVFQIYLCVQSLLTEAVKNAYNQNYLWSSDPF